MPQNIYNRASKGIIGDQDAGGGALRSAPLELLNQKTHLWGFNDFVGSSDYGTSSFWTATDIGTSGGSVALTQTFPGTLVIDCGVTTQKGFQAQLTTNSTTPRTQGFGFNASVLGASKEWGWGTRLQVNTASAGHIIAGMCASDTTLQDPITGAPAPAAALMYIAFSVIAGVLYAYSSRTSGLTLTTALGPVLVDATYIDLAFRVVNLSTFTTGGTTLDTTDGYTEFYVNGVKKGVHSGYIGQSSTLLPSFGAINGAGAIDLTVDYFYQFAQRPGVSL